MGSSFDKQFEMVTSDFMRNLDFLNWFRYFYLLKDIVRLSPRSVLEIGAGEGIIKKCVTGMVDNYFVLDINAKLLPDIVGDVRDFYCELENRFDLVVIADVLEHIPFGDLFRGLSNIARYMKDDSKLLVTIPHRRSNFLFMTPNYIPRVLTVPTGFLSLGSFYRRFIKRKIWIDPHHCWEIGDGSVRVKDVEKVFSECEFSIEYAKKLLYVDYWILCKRVK